MERDPGEVTRADARTPADAPGAAGLASTWRRQGGGRCGPYVLGAPIGAGGYGAVYRGRDARTGVEVAVKVLTQLGGHARARFQREVEAARRLDHPSIVRTLDHGEEGGRPYLVMELVPVPDDVHTWVYLAFARTDAGEPKERVIEACDRALAIDPRQADALALRGQARLARDPAGAVEDLTAAAEHTPSPKQREEVLRLLERARRAAAR